MFVFQEFAHRVCKVLTCTLLSEWHDKLKRQTLLFVLSNIFLDHPFVYETARNENLLPFLVSKLKIMQLQIAKQSTQKSVCIY